jgi:hypothetical protein
MIIEDDSELDLQMIEDIMPGTAVGLGVIQGKIGAEFAPSEFLDALAEYEVLDTDKSPSERVDIFFAAINEEVGTANMLSAILSLMGVGIIAVDADKVKEYFEVKDAHTRELN